MPSPFKNQDVHTAHHGADVRWTLDPDDDIGLVISPALDSMPVYLHELDLEDMLFAIQQAKRRRARAYRAVKL